MRTLLGVGWVFETGFGDMWPQFKGCDQERCAGPNDAALPCCLNVEAWQRERKPVLHAELIKAYVYEVLAAGSERRRDIDH
jgi:hypothetical protein